MYPDPPLMIFTLANDPFANVPSTNASSEPSPSASVGDPVISRIGDTFKLANPEPTVEMLVSLIVAFVADPAGFVAPGMVRMSPGS